MRVCTYPILLIPRLRKGCWMRVPNVDHSFCSTCQSATVSRFPCCVTTNKPFRDYYRIAIGYWKVDRNSPTNFHYQHSNVLQGSHDKCNRYSMKIASQLLSYRVDHCCGSTKFASFILGPFTISTVFFMHCEQNDGDSIEQEIVVPILTSWANEPNYCAWRGTTNAVS